MPQKGATYDMRYLLSVGVILLVGAGILIGISSDLSNSVRDTLLDASVRTNQTIVVSSVTNNTYIELYQGEVTGITRISNQSLTLQAGNYSLTSGESRSGVTVQLSCAGCTTDSTVTNWNVTYNYNAITTASAAVGNATIGVGNFNMPSVGTVLGAAVILVIIFGFMGLIVSRGREE